MNDETRRIYRRTTEQLRAAAVGKHAELLLMAAYQIEQLVNILDQTDTGQNFTTLARDIVAQAANQALVVHAKVEKK